VGADLWIHILDDARCVFPDQKYVTDLRVHGSIVSVVSAENDVSGIHYVHRVVFQLFNVRVAEKIPLVAGKQISEHVFNLIFLQSFVARGDTHQICVASV
jgi:hypothetical protein